MALQSFPEIEPVSHTVRHHPSSGLHGQRPSVRPELVRRRGKVLFTAQIFPDRTSETSC